MLTDVHVPSVQQRNSSGAVRMIVPLTPMVVIPLTFLSFPSIVKLLPVLDTVMKSNTRPICGNGRLIVIESVIWIMMGRPDIELSA